MLGAAAMELFSGIPQGNVFVFPDLRDPSLPVRGLDWAWVRIRERAGLADVRIHDLRHSFASAGRASGQGLPLIGKLLGHAHVATTSRYAHLADDPVRSAADRISNVMRNSLDGIAADIQPLRKSQS